MIQECIFAEGSMSTWRKKIEKARFHSVISIGTKEQRFDNHWREGVLPMSEAKGASLTMLPCHRGLFCIWVRCCVVCFSLFHKGSRCTDLVSWDIRHRYSRTIHSTKFPSNAHPRSIYEEGHRPTTDALYPERNGRVRGWKEEKTLQLMWSRRSHLQEVPRAFSTHCCCRGWTFWESDGWIGSTYKNSPHLVVHVTACNVFVCTKLNILCLV